MKLNNLFSVKLGPISTISRRIQFLWYIYSKCHFTRSLLIRINCVRQALPYVTMQILGSNMIYSVNVSMLIHCMPLCTYRFCDTVYPCVQLILWIYQKVVFPVIMFDRCISFLANHLSECIAMAHYRPTDHLLLCSQDNSSNVSKHIWTEENS